MRQAIGVFLQFRGNTTVVARGMYQSPCSWVHKIRMDCFLLRMASFYGSGLVHVLYGLCDFRKTRNEIDVEGKKEAASPF
jgi:hypothetical protein